MKKLIFTVSTVCIILTNIMAQVPQAINFQAIARDGSGSIMSNTDVMIRLSVIDSVAGGAIVYQELRALQTDLYGSFNFQIGFNPDFVTTGVFADINWATGSKYLKIDYDPTNTFNWGLTLGTIGFSTVPYAFTSGSVTNIITTGANNGDILKYNSSTSKWEPGANIPIGTVVPFAGSVVPSGWMLCDGSAISRTTYAALFAVIGNSWGAGDYTTTFNLPDMRGVFMRGLDGSAGNDPDKTSRTAIHAGGNTGNNVGSYQNDAFQGHYHYLHIPSLGDRSSLYTGSYPGNHVGITKGIVADETYSITGARTDGTNGTPRTSSETRPKNVYVNYIIKY